MKQNTRQQIYRRMGRVGLIVLLFMFLSSSSVLFGQEVISEITAANEDDAIALPLLLPVALLEKNGIALEEFLKQLRQRVEITVESAGFVQEIGAASSARLQSSTEKPAGIVVHNAGAAQTLDLMLATDQAIENDQDKGISVQQAGAQATVALLASSRFVASSPQTTGIQVEQAGSTRELDLIWFAWP